MFDIELQNIVSIVETVLGESRRGVNIDGWTEYNCPNCAFIDNVESDCKYNLCVNYRSGTYHCWKCLEKGRLSKLLKQYGSERLVSEYYSEIQNIKNSRLFHFSDDNNTIINDLLTNENYLKLPNGFKKLNRNDRYAQKAYKYLEERNISDFFIEKFNIGYVGWNDNYKYGNRIIIPSYNAYGELNYWIGRDYSGKSKLKYINPDIEKTKIIFNENLINWYEDVTIVEGVFDHMVIPNSIPLLGKILDNENIAYHELINNCMANVNILLDDDATDDAIEMYKLLNNGILKDRIRLIECPNGYDASLIYQKFGRKGVIQLMNRARKLSDYELL